MPANPSAAKLDTIQTGDCLAQRMLESTGRLIEELNKVQTEIVGAFQSWTQAIDAGTQTVPLIEERLSLLEDRVGRIERGERFSG